MTGRKTPPSLVGGHRQELRSIRTVGGVCSPRVVAVEEPKSKASTPPDQGSQELQLMAIPATSSFKTSLLPQERPAVAPAAAVAPTRPPPPQADEEEYEDDAEAFEVGQVLMLSLVAGA